MFSNLLNKQIFSIFKKRKRKLSSNFATHDTVPLIIVHSTHIKGLKHAIHILARVIKCEKGAQRTL
jgi:hypothetical protein